MRHRKRRLVFSFLALSFAVISAPRAEARNTRGHHHSLHNSSHHGRRATTRRHGHVIQCVAFVHQAGDFNIRGNARDWWSHAEGVYARGNNPEEGSVLSFRSTRRMPLGHVALLKSVLDNRTILIDQSHWASRGVSRNVRVVDVSPNNDWTLVRVALNGNTDRLGSIYPTNGFIYHRAPHNGESRGLVMASNMQDASFPQSVTNESTETASAPSADDSFDDAPNRALR